ncbi:LemA family protein [Candidatus Woesearchaeota archaeon]|nr:LemA family protein [Candidatus Woesearchaeota archaeon]
MMGIIWFSGILVGLILLYIIYTYNHFIVLRNRIDNAWSQIDVQLKRRFDLIPNLVETVKGYAKHEKTTFADITKARSMMAKATTISKKAEAENMLEGALKTLFAVTENYPKLMANENFKLLQEELAGTENKISYSRQFYNDSVMTFNTMVESFPPNIMAKMLNLKKREFFEMAEVEKKPVKVSF